MNQATTIDAKGKTLTFNTNVTDNSTIHAIGANSTDGVTITADKLVLNAHSTKGRVEAINVGGQGQQNKDKPMKLTINGDTEMNVKGINYALGLYAAGNSEVTFNGNVTAMGDENSEWGLRRVLMVTMAALWYTAAATTPCRQDRRLLSTVM